MRRLSVLALLVFALGCASFAPAPHKVGVSAGTTGFVSGTLYSATVSSGKQIVFTTGFKSLSILARTGTFWVRPHAGDEACSGGAPSNPIPSANAVATGWVRLTDGQTLQYGGEDTPPKLAYLVLCIDVWPEVLGDLLWVGRAT